MPRNRKWNKLHRLQRLLAQNLQSFEERRLALREALTDDTFGTRAESEWGFASAARGLGAGLLSISAHTVQSIGTLCAASGPALTEAATTAGERSPSSGCARFPSRRPASNARSGATSRGAEPSRRLRPSPLPNRESAGLVDARLPAAR